MSGTADVAKLKAEAAALRWYHTLQLAEGVVTDGEYDVGSVAANFPWPSLQGIRCLDVGSRDGFYAFEMERRGAAEVISIDIDDPESVHFPATVEAPRHAVEEELADGNRAFAFAKAALGSEVQRRMVSVYDLDPADMGTFGFGVIGTLLLHLRDPIGALAALRRVVDGRLLIVEAVAPTLDLLRRRPTATLVGRGGPFWWGPNRAGLARMAEAAGFRLVEQSRPFMIPLGAGPRAMAAPPVLGRPLRELPARLLLRRGSLHVWLLVASA